MSIGCSRYFLRLPSRMARAIPAARPRLGLPSAVPLETDHRPAVANDLAGVVKVGRRLALAELQLDELGLAELLGDARQRPVVNELAVRDDQHARAQGLDVAHVMAG